MAELKTRNGYPTKKYIQELCDEKCLRNKHLVNWGNNHTILWVGASQNEAAAKVAEQLRIHAYKCTVVFYLPLSPRHGKITIERS